MLVPTAAHAADVTVTDDAVDPDPVVVPVGESVVMTNAGADDVRLIDDDGRWDSGVLAPGESFRITFDLPGTVTFTAEDDSLTGSIEITESETDAAEAAGDEAAEDGTAEATDGEPAAEELADTGAPTDLLALAAATALGMGAVVLRRTAKA